MPNMSATGLSADPYTISQLFSETNVRYLVPIYQRNFAWGADQIEQLIEDIWTARPGVSNPYFLGNLIVAIPENKKYPAGTYEVVDGQQRLTTLYLLLTYLQSINRGEIDNFEGKLTYEARRATTEALNSPNTLHASKDMAIQTGYKIIQKAISSIVTDAEAERFSKCLADHVVLVRAILPTGTDLNRYFEVMNTRGQQLQQVDILKARLMSYLGKSKDNVERAQRTFATIWQACAEMDRYVQMALTPGKTELRTRIFGDNWAELKAKRFNDLCNILEDSNGDSAAHHREPLSLEAALEYYTKIGAQTNKTDEEEGRFETPIRFTNLLLHALKLMGTGEANNSEDEGQLDDSRLISTFDTVFDPLSERERAERVVIFIEQLLRCKFILDNFVLKREYVGNNIDDGKWSLKRLLKRNNQPAYPPAFSQSDTEADLALDDQTRNIMLLQSMLRITYTSPRTMHWITAILRLPLTEIKRSDAATAINQTLIHYARRKVKEAFFGGAQPSGFEIQRIVFTYLDYLLAMSKFPDFEFAFRNSIEHFFPQGPDTEQAFHDRLNGDQEALHDFGNLALVSVGANSKFSNSMPEFKIQYKDLALMSCKLQEMYTKVENLQKAERRWDSDAIEAHGEEMIEILKEDLREAGLVD